MAELETESTHAKQVRAFNHNALQRKARDFYHNAMQRTRLQNIIEHVLLTIIHL